MNFSIFWDVTQRRFVKNRRFGATYLLQLEGSCPPFPKDGTDRPETSNINKPMLRNIPEDGIIRVNRSESNLASSRWSGCVREGESTCAHVPDDVEIKTAIKMNGSKM